MGEFGLVCWGRAGPEHGTGLSGAGLLSLLSEGAPKGLGGFLSRGLCSGLGMGSEIQRERDKCSNPTALIHKRSNRWVHKELGYTQAASAAWFACALPSAALKIN